MQIMKGHKCKMNLIFGRSNNKMLVSESGDHPEYETVVVPEHVERVRFPNKGEITRFCSIIIQHVDLKGVRTWERGLFPSLANVFCQMLTLRIEWTVRTSALLFNVHTIKSHVLQHCHNSEQCLPRYTSSESMAMLQ